MTETRFFQILIYAFFPLSAVTFLSLQFITAPYGRHAREGWGPKLSSTAGWLLMEAPAPLMFAACYAVGERALAPASLALFALWEMHYLHRAFIFPFRRRGGEKPMALAIACTGLAFNVINGYLNGRNITHFAAYPVSWLWDPRFVAGAALFLFGFVVNYQSDRILMNLRAPGESGYKIPRGGLYRFISSPNYFGEMIEWSGWALATWSLPGLAFAVWTAANLAPRAFANHKWYREKFPDYPRERRALIPFLC